MHYPAGDSIFGPTPSKGRFFFIASAVRFFHRLLRSGKHGEESLRLAYGDL